VIADLGPGGGGRYGAAVDEPSRDSYDVVVVGGGHNGLACASYLAGAGRSVVVLERSGTLGGAAQSERVFGNHGANLSKYSYLVSLLPELIVDELDLDIQLVRRRFSSYTPQGESGILIDSGDADATRIALGADGPAWDEFYERTTILAARVFPTLTEPLLDRDQFRRVVGDDTSWCDLFERPIGELLERQFLDDTVRGIVLTDALIGTFTHAHDDSLLANRCLLYHVIGRGTGLWDVPRGGMGAVSSELAAAAAARGAELVTGAEVVAIATDGERPTVTMADGRRITALQVGVNVAPSVLQRLLAAPDDDPYPEGAQLKINMLLSRLPRLRDSEVPPEQAFAGTFHVNEGYGQLETAYRHAAAGVVPELAPCEVYCHSLTDPSILAPELQAAGVHTLTLFGLHMPDRLFRDDPDGALALATASILGSFDRVLAEPIRDCLVDDDCIEVMGPREIEANLGMPGGHIFHRDLQWPFAERSDDVGRWGVETANPNVFLCGAGARRGGGVSAIPGRNAAMAMLER